MSSITEIHDISQWKSHIERLSTETILIILFYAPWAAPCSQMRTILETLATGYAATDPPTTSWVAVNAEELSDISEEYDVSAVPYLVICQSGKILDTSTGIDATKVRAMIEKHTKTATIMCPPASIEASEPTPIDSKRRELFSRLEQLVKASSVMLFMKGSPDTPECGFSRQIVGILREHSVKYGFFNILADDEVRQGLKEFADWPTYPQLWINGELIGGLDIVSHKGLYPHAIIPMEYFKPD
jgi:Grx4 family monothiol glutaredoxin